ncbi:hypothetical protein OPW19_06635 [Vibrio europaeus]|uniref:GapS6b family protein n=1 Tax=Vibrio europaeus TaxID=300876 RepID=UPI00233EA6E5|nr:hypothetical protein [Vibrio europaeus]MDC5819504.1 hypothetical protein [Vibrio europaeus]MDC5871944.1 hypothetical protein [Vibrio europaeus]
MVTHSRHNFTEKTLRQLRENVANLCSNPECKVLTRSSKSDESESTCNLGVGAHITAAATGGPRYDPLMSESDRKSYSNGIWLCYNCSRIIDVDPHSYSVALLNEWRVEAENYARNNIGKPLVPKDDLEYKVIIEDIQSKNLEAVAHNILTDIRHREFEVAEDKLKVLMEIGDLAKDAKQLLKILSGKLLLSQEETSDFRQDLVSFKKSKNQSDPLKAIADAILIELESKTSPELALERYKSLQETDEHCEEAYFEFLAPIEAIENVFGSPDRLDYGEAELTGLARGAMRNRDIKLAIEITSYLNKHFPSKNSQTLLLYYESSELVVLNTKAQLWNYTKATIDKFNQLKSELLAWFKTHRDKRNVYTLVNLLSLSQFSDKQLFELSLEHVDAIEKIDPQLSEEIKRCSSVLSAPSVQVDLSTLVLDVGDYAQLYEALENKTLAEASVQSWLSRGGTISGEDELTSSFLQLCLTSRVCEMDDRKQIQEIGLSAEKFLEKYSERLHSITLMAVNELCQNLNRLGLSNISLRYLEPLVPEDSWASPLFVTYLYSLRWSDKLESLKEKLTQVHADEKNVNIWIAEAWLEECVKDYRKAILAVKAALKLAPEYSYAWQLLLTLERCNGSNRDNRRKIVYEIPPAVFSQDDPDTVGLVYEIAMFVDVELADRVLVDWFVKNPLRHSETLTQIHFNSRNERSEVYTNRFTPDYCLDGVTFTDGFRTHNKLLVRGINSPHPAMLDIESPIGSAISGLSEGETARIGGKEFTVIERLPPYIASFRLALKIRDEQNDGSDPFESFELPTNNDELIPQMEKILKRYSVDESKQFEVLENPNIPLVLRGKYTHEHKPVLGAAKHLTSTESTKYMQLYRGDLKPEGPILIDVYSAVYLSLMGLVRGLDTLGIETVFTSETKAVISAWLNDIQSQDYLSLSVNERGLQRVTAKDIESSSSFLIDDLVILLDRSRVEDLKVSDAPDELLQIRDAMDLSVYSTFQLSIANGTSWFSIDHHISILAEKISAPVVSSYHLVEMLYNALSLTDKRKAIGLHLQSGTPLAIPYSDIAELALSSDNLDAYIVSKFVDKYGHTLDSPQYCLNFLVQVAGSSTVEAYLDQTLLKGGRVENASYDGYAEHVFNRCSQAAMKSVLGNSAEERLVLFVVSLLQRYGQTQNYVSLIFRLLTNFAQGHFLDRKEIADLLKAKLNPHS